MTRPKSEKPQTRNVNVGHLRQSLLAMRKRMDDEANQITRLMEVLDYLEEKGSLTIDSDGVDQTEANFIKWLRRLRERKVLTYADFQAYSDKVGTPIVREAVEQWIGRKLPFGTIDDMAKRLLKED